MSSEQGYNGWVNYETGNVALWLDNDEGTYRYWQETAQEVWNEASAETSFTRDERAALDLADQLKRELNDDCPIWDTLGASMYADLLNASLSEVNWLDVANHILEGIDKSESESEDEDDDEDSAD